MNRRLTSSELDLAKRLLIEIDKRLDDLAKDDASLRWALRRKIYKELMYGERGKPMQRKILKLQKRESQKGVCAVCGGDLPVRDSILDRLDAMGGYTAENTRVICRPCDLRIQEERKFT